MIPILDTHLHLLYQESFNYDWCADAPALNHDFKIETYQDIIEGHGVTRSIFMEVDVRENEIPAEAKFFTDLVKQSNNPLVGVIASCRPEEDDFQQRLDATLTDSVCGLRRILHTMPNELSQSEQFRENIRSLGARNLPFDLCINQDQLAKGIGYDLVTACPDTQFILNHCGVPTISSDEFDTWKTALQKIATLPNIVCKVSGIIAYCPTPEEATLETLRPWLEATAETFGADRLVLGSDWPVCNLTKGLPTWLEIIREFFSTYSDEDQHAIFHRNAEKIYRLKRTIIKPGSSKILIE